MSQSNRLWVIATVTAIAAILLAGWFLGAEPLVASAQAADAERVGVDAQNAANQASIAKLTEDKKSLPKLTKDFKALQVSIPGDSDTSAFITGVNSLAISSGVQVAGLTVAPPTAYTVPTSGAAPTTDTAAAGSSSTATPVAPVAAGPTAPVAVTSPLITPDNFVGIQVTVDVVGPYDSVLGFVKGLQTDGRLFLVTAFTSAKNVSGSGSVDSSDSGDEAAPPTNVVTAKVTGFIYVIKGNTAP